jgi:hypothetical protein
MKTYIVLCASLHLHSGLPFKCGDKIAEDKIKPEHLPDLLSAKFIEEYKEPKPSKTKTDETV